MRMQVAFDSVLVAIVANLQLFQSMLPRPELSSRANACSPQAASTAAKRAVSGKQQRTQQAREYEATGQPAAF